MPIKQAGHCDHLCMQLVVQNRVFNVIALESGGIFVLINIKSGFLNNQQNARLTIPISDCLINNSTVPGNHTVE